MAEIGCSAKFRWNRPNICRAEYCVVKIGLLNSLWCWVELIWQTRVLMVWPRVDFLTDIHFYTRATTPHILQPRSS